jgi:hypothetical protein
LKTIKLVCLFTLLAVVFVSIGAVYAQTNEATVTATLSKNSVGIGEAITISVTVQNTGSQEYKILRYGIHGDWMSTADDFQGPNLAGNPATLTANGAYQGNFYVSIPTTANVGSYNYYIGVDAQDASGNYYSWNSAQSTLQIVPAGTTVITPTPSPTGAPSQGGNTPLGSADLLFYVAIVAIVAMVILAILVLFTLKRRSHPRSAPQPVSNPPTEQPKPETPPPPQETPQEKPSSGEEFDI